MIRLAQEKAPIAAVGDNVSLAIDKVDHGPCDMPSIVCLEVFDDGSVKLGCRKDVLEGRYFCNQYRLNKAKTIAVEDVPNMTFKSVWALNGAISQFGTQGHLHCNCSGNCLNEKGTRGKGCKCKKNGQECNSRCHPGHSCRNNAL